jgi:hypothetical protein
MAGEILGLASLASLLIGANCKAALFEPQCRLPPRLESESDLQCFTLGHQLERGRYCVCESQASVCPPLLLLLLVPSLPSDSPGNNALPPSPWCLSRRARGASGTQYAPAHFIKFCFTLLQSAQLLRSQPASQLAINSFMSSRESCAGHIHRSLAAGTLSGNIARSCPSSTVQYNV